MDINFKQYFLQAIVVFAICILLMLVAYISIKLMGPDNMVENTIEKVVDKTVEVELHLPPDTVDIDLTPKKPYPDNS